MRRASTHWGSSSVMELPDYEDAVSSRFPGALKFHFST